MDIYSFLAVVIGGGGVGTVVTVVVNGLKDKRANAKQAMSLNDTLKLSRLRWRDYAYELLGIMRRDGVKDIPDEPEDPWLDALDASK